MPSVLKSSDAISLPSQVAILSAVVNDNDPATLFPIFEQIKKLKPEQVEVLQAMLNQMK